MLGECRRRKQQPHAEALAGPVVLEDHGEPDLLGSIGNVVATDHGNRVRSRDSKCREVFVLSNLRKLELEGPLAVDHHAAVALEPSQHSCRELGGVAMAASVRGGTHTVVEDALGRRHREMEHAFIEEPLAQRSSEDGELAAQRLDPGVILMDHEDTRRSCTREVLCFHEPSRMCGSDQYITAPNIGPNGVASHTRAPLGSGIIVVLRCLPLLPQPRLTTVPASTAPEILSRAPDANSISIAPGGVD